jgi:hypothetical protein
MKIKHNKKRNTAVVYEALLKDMTAAILKGDDARKASIVGVIKEHFSRGTVLNKDLSCYRSLYETKDETPETSQRIIFEAKKQKMAIDKEKLFEAQTKVIHDINKNIDSSIFSNFVPNYKTLATIHQIFSDNITPKERVLLENQMTQYMCEKIIKQEAPQVDTLTLAKFIEKFNQRYDDKLLDEQKVLLSHYITSFTDNNLSLKMYLNDEVARLKEQLNSFLSDTILQEDSSMLNKTKKVIEKIESLKTSDINEDTLATVLRTQALVKEFKSDGANS